MPGIAEENAFRSLHHQPVRSNNSVRRTYDLLRATLPALEPDAPLSEGELIDSFSASRNTVRMVLQLLAAEGLVSRRPKVGTTVAGCTVIPIEELTPLAQWSRHRPTTGRVLETRVMPAFTAISQRLSLPEGSLVAVTEGLVMEDTEPLALFVSYVGLTREQADLMRAGGLSVIAFLEAQLGVSVVESDTVMTAIACDEQTAALLGVAEGSPLLSLEELLRDADGTPWAVCQIRCRADRIAFSAKARRTGGSTY